MKGEISLKTLKAMIFMIVTIFVLTIVIAQIMIQINKSVDRSVCSSSVAAQASAHIKGVGFAPEELNCPTKEMVLKGSDEKKLKLAVAEEMRKCWGDFGEGRAELFDREQVFCSECAIIRFQDKDVSLTRFSDFLIDAKMPDDDDKRSYAEYLTRFQTGQLRTILDNARSGATQSESTDIIYGEKTYSVVLVYVKGRGFISQWKDKLPTLGGAAVAGFGAMGLVGGGSAYLMLVTLGNPFGLAITTVTVGVLSVAAGTVAAIEAFTMSESPEWMSMVLLKERTEDQFVDLGCEYFPSVQQNINKREP